MAQILYLWCKGSVVIAHRLSCSVACGILVPWPGIEPMSFALQGRFLTTGSSGKSPDRYFKLKVQTVRTCIQKVLSQVELKLQELEKLSYSCFTDMDSAFNLEILSPVWIQQKLEQTKAGISQWFYWGNFSQFYTYMRLYILKKAKQCSKALGIVHGKAYYNIIQLHRA